ncbi:MAG: tetratricopeptide repeat protein, partial [Planctomycetota bacterium]|nr:tetratricopeptide repeat protein [Planctomycetota bacterium]
QHQRLLKLYEEFLKTKPTSALFHYLLGRLQMDMEKEREYYKKAVELDEKFYWGHFGLGYVYSSEKDFESAKKEYQKCIEIDPARPEGYFRLGKTLKELSEYEEALKIYEKMAQVLPKDPIPYMEMAQTQAERGLHKEAVEFYKKADSLGARSVEFIVGYADSLSAAGEKEEAVKLLSRLLESPQMRREDYAKLSLKCRALFVPPLPEHLYNDFIKALKGLDEGRPEEAIETLEKLQKEAPDEPIILQALARCYLQKQDVDKTVQYTKKALEKNKDFADAHFLLGMIYAIQGDLKTAAVHLKRCVELNPFDSEGTMQYAQLLIMEKEFLKAIVYALRYWRLSENLRDAQALAMTAELGLETPELLEKEIESGGMTVKVFRGLKHALPGYRFIWRFRIYEKGGELKRTIFVLMLEEVAESETGEKSVKRSYGMKELRPREERVEVVEHFEYDKEPSLEKSLEDLKKILEK